MPNNAFSERDEEMIDESLMETFPASDPTSPARPGSLIGMRYAVNSRGGHLGWLQGTTPLWLLAAVAGCVAIGITLASRRRA